MDSNPAIPVSDRDKVHVTVDLVVAARRHVSFLQTLSDSTVLHHRPTTLRSIQRYEEQWMPLISDLTRIAPRTPLLLPPLDVLWVWHCHCLSPERYRDYCRSKFGVMVKKPTVFDEENEDYAFDRCREIWTIRFPSEPFDLVEPLGSEAVGVVVSNVELLDLVERHRDLYDNFCDLFVMETVYLFSARHRYKCFLHLCKRNNGSGVRLVPTSDILLMWQLHQSFPVTYERDMEAMGLCALERCAVAYGDNLKEMEVEETKKLWEEVFDEPYEKAGSSLRPVDSPSRMLLYWESFDADVNKRYKALHPRSMLEVLVFLKGNWNGGKRDVNSRRMSLRLHTLRCHKKLNLDMPISSLSSESWQKSWQLYCEFGTRGVILEIRRQSSNFLLRSKAIRKLVFNWVDVLRTPLLSLSEDFGMQAKALVSVTPPVQAPYLLKCVPDRVTDDSGAMISEIVLRMNSYHPQTGRWLTRTVIDHERRECFVIRIRIGEGFWRRGAETPRIVKWEDRIIEVYDGPWSYIASSVGKAPKKIVGKAIPLEKDTQTRKATWSLSTGGSLTIRWEADLEFQLDNKDSNDLVRILRGRQLQYKVKDPKDNSNFEKEEEHFLTLVRYSPEYENGKATALLNWRLFAMEFLPAEDATFVLLLCTVIVRTISEIKGEDVGRLLVRRRVKEEKAGTRDWGSVMLPGPSNPHLNPWFWNAAEVLSAAEVFDARQPSHLYSSADGKEDMYKQAILQ